jgi:hypothetical protein
VSVELHRHPRGLVSRRHSIPLQGRGGGVTMHDVAQALGSGPRAWPGP